MKKLLVINPQVYDDLSAIKKYISKDNPQEAEKVVRAISDKIESLSELSERGANLQNKTRQKTKYKFILVLKNYAILYYTTADTVHVTLVMHAARDLSALRLINPEN